MAVQHGNFSSPEDYQKIANGGGYNPKTEVSVPTIRVEDMEDVNHALNYGTSGGSGRGFGWAGDKYPGSLPAGFGFNDDFEITDLETIRRRSKQLFQRNIYFAGLVRRLVTNEINTGLVPQALIMPTIIGLSDQEAALWSDQVEELFMLYANDPMQFHWKENSMPMSTFDQELRRGAIILGDMLVIERTNKYGTPSYQLIPGSNVVTPLEGAINSDNRIKEGVEVDKNGRHVAYYVINWETGKIERIPAWGRRSGRRTAWLVYGSDQKYDGVRGIPLLGIIIQSLKELDVYRDAEMRAAVVNSMIAVFMTKDAPGVGSGALGKGAVKRTSVSSTDVAGGTREFQSNQYMPGMIMTELAQGEKPESFNTNRPNANYEVFERAILSAVAWCNQIPPEILLMQFSHNYSASKAANAEFSIYLDYVRKNHSIQFHKHVYESWLLGMVLSRRLAAPGLLESWRDNTQRAIYTAWTNTSWKGAIKPSVDLLKDVRAYAEACEEGFADRELASLTLFGGSHRNFVRNLKNQNLLLAEANEPLAELMRSEREPVSSTSDEQD